MSAPGDQEASPGGTPAEIPQRQLILEGPGDVLAALERQKTQIDTLTEQLATLMQLLETSRISGDGGPRGTGGDGSGGSGGGGSGGGGPNGGGDPGGSGPGGGSRDPGNTGGSAGNNNPRTTGGGYYDPAYEEEKKRLAILRNMQLPSLPKLSGSPEQQNLTYWLLYKQNALTYYTLLRCSGPMAVELFMGYCEGPVLTYWQSNHHNFATLKDFFTGVERDVFRTSIQVAASDKLDTYKKSKDEPIISLEQTIKMLAAAAGIPDTDESTLKRKFRNALPAIYKQHVDNRAKEFCMDRGLVVDNYIDVIPFDRLRSWAMIYEDTLRQTQLTAARQERLQQRQQHRQPRNTAAINAMTAAGNGNQRSGRESRNWTPLYIQRWAKTLQRSVEQIKERADKRVCFECAGEHKVTACPVWQKKKQSSQGPNGRAQ